MILSHNAAQDMIIGIKSAGEIASGVASRLFQSGFHHIFMMDKHSPMAVRRAVSFCESLTEGEKQVEGVHAVRAESETDIKQAWHHRKIPVIVDEDWSMIQRLEPYVVIDAIIAKQNLGTTIKEAPLVIALGPGFEAGRDVHVVIETNRGHHLGRVITKGSAEENTGIPGSIAGFAVERVLRAPDTGAFEAFFDIGDPVKSGESVGKVNNAHVTARIDGILRGLIRPGSPVKKGMKIGDIDPRGRKDYCWSISDKARSVGGGVLEAILHHLSSQR